jgi:hypothetical protein
VRPAGGLLAADEDVVVASRKSSVRAGRWRPAARLACRDSKNDAGADVDHDRDRLLDARLSSTSRTTSRSSSGGRLSTT